MTAGARIMLNVALTSMSDIAAQRGSARADKPVAGHQCVTSRPLPDAIAMWQKVRETQEST